MASTLVFMGCTEEDDDLLGPVDTWCEMPITKTDTNNEETVLGYIAVVYSNDGFTGSTTSSQNLKNKLEIEPGLTVVVYTKTIASGTDLTSTILNGFSSNQYVMKTFPKDSSTTVTDSDGSSSSLKGNRALWTAIYYGKSDLRKADNQFENPKATAPLTNGGNYTVLSKDNFSWQKILLDYLSVTLVD